jgi:cytochrome c peroxidase
MKKHFYITEKIKMKTSKFLLLALLGLATFSANADVTNAEKLATKYYSIAKEINPDFKAPSVADGKTFFNRQFTVKGKKIACASCHTSNPADEGTHIVTGKTIRPLSPSVNTKRFTDIDKVEEKFTEHCNDILGADCTAAEKSNFISYLITEKTPSVKK